MLHNKQDSTRCVAVIYLFDKGPARTFVVKRGGGGLRDQQVPGVCTRPNQLLHPPSHSQNYPPPPRTLAAPSRLPLDPALPPQASLLLSTARLRSCMALVYWPPFLAIALTYPSLLSSAPLTPQVSLLLATALLSSCMALVRNAAGFAILRFLLGSSLGSFVIAQFWMTDCFDPSVLGAVAAICAGWGNAGSGAAMLVMPFLYEMLYDGSGGVASSVEAWRTAFFFLSAALVLVAVLTLLFGQDTPRGDLIDLQRRKAASELWSAGQLGSDAGVVGSGKRGGGRGRKGSKQQREREHAKRKAERQQAQLQQLQQQQRERALRAAAASNERGETGKELQGAKQKQALGLVERAGSLLQRRERKDRDGGRDRKREGEEKGGAGGIAGSSPVAVSSFTAPGVDGIKAGPAAAAGAAAGGDGAAAAASQPLYGRSTTQDGAEGPVGGGRTVRGRGGSRQSSAPSFRQLRAAAGPLVVLGGPSAVGEGVEYEQGDEGQGGEGGEQGAEGIGGAGEASRDPRVLDVTVAVSGGRGCWVVHGRAWGRGLAGGRGREKKRARGRGGLGWEVLPGGACL